MTDTTTTDLTRVKREVRALLGAVRRRGDALDRLAASQGETTNTLTAISADVERLGINLKGIK